VWDRIKASPESHRDMFILYSSGEEKIEKCKEA
jgi:hypothetical protein